jgi:hypothetical protein
MNNLSNTSPTSPTGGPQPLTHNALVKAIKELQYQGHKVEYAYNLSLKEGSEITVNGNLVTIKHENESIKLDLSNAKTEKSLSSSIFKNKSSEDEDMANPKITTLAHRILAATGTKKVYFKDPISEDVSSKPFISKKEINELKTTLNQLKKNIEQLQNRKAPTFKLQEVGSEFQKVLTSTGDPETYKQCSDLLKEISNAQPEIGPSAVKALISKASEFYERKKFGDFT